MGIAVFIRIPCVVQVGHHYSAPMSQYLGAIDRYPLGTVGGILTDAFQLGQGGPINFGLGGSGHVSCRLFFICIIVID